MPIRVGESLPSLRSWRRFSWQEKSSFTLMLMVKVATFPGCKGNWARVSSSFQLKKSPYGFSTRTATKVMTLMSQRHHETQQPPEKVHVHLQQGKMHPCKMWWIKVPENSRIMAAARPWPESVSAAPDKSSTLCSQEHPPLAE